VTVPNLVAVDQATASATLQQLGLVVAVKTASNRTVAPGLVISASPSVDRVVVRGTSVTLTVSSGPKLVSVPYVVGWSADDAFEELQDAGFAVAFVTISIFWVNHHHFFHRVAHTDWKLLWLNNLLLFWLATVPFTTAFVGDYPSQPLALGVFTFSMVMAAIAFTLMGHYVFFSGELVDPSVSMAQRRREYRRGWIGVIAYSVTLLLAFVWVPAVQVALVALPFAWVVPNLMDREEE
jgi:uncharacterized membrane protein